MNNYRHSSNYVGARSSAVGWGTAPQSGRSSIRFPMVSLEFFIDIILPAALRPWGWLSLYQKWIPGIFSGGKGGRYVGLTTLPPSCAVCVEIWRAATSWNRQGLSRSLPLPRIMCGFCSENFRVSRILRVSGFNPLLTEHTHTHTHITFLYTIDVCVLL